MKNHVTVIPSDQIIIVDGEALPCTFAAQTEGLHALQWHNGKGELEIITDGIIQNRPIENYTETVQPYIDIWQAKYDEIHTPYVPTLEEAKTAKLAALESAFNAASEQAHCPSSVGFEIDADEIANRNIEGLVLVMAEGDKTLFRAYDNSFHEVTREQLEVMRREIVVNSQYLYQAKWTTEARIQAAQTVGELEAMTITAESLAELANTLKAAATERVATEKWEGV